MFNFSEKTERCLRNSGWYVERKFDISDYINLLLEGNYSINNAAIEFLSSFGGLHIIFERDGEPDNMEFDAIKADGYFFPYWIKSDYPKRTSLTLCPIGVAYRANMILSMNELGHVYAGIDAIENICNDNKDKFISIE